MTRYRLVACSDGPLSEGDIHTAVRACEDLWGEAGKAASLALAAALKGAGDAWQPIESDDIRAGRREVSISIEECERRIQFATSELRRQLVDMRDALTAAEFRAALAEWAVAGVAFRNINVSVDYGSAMQSGIDLARHLGASAGARLLHDAGLAFKDHAEHSRCMAETPPHKHYRPAAQEQVGRIFWPRPFERKRP